MATSQLTDLQSRCDLLRSLHRPGTPLLLPNAWDAATARAVVAAGFPVVATGSVAVAAALGYEDHHAPAEEMFAAAARIVNAVEVPVTVDAEAGYDMEPDELVAALRSAGAAGCNLEDSDAGHTLRDADGQAERLAAVRRAAEEDGYPLVINARVDVLFGPMLAGATPGTQHELVPEALQARERVPRGRRGLRVPDRPVGVGCAAPVHVGGPRAGEPGAAAAGAVAGGAGRAGRGPGELGAAALPRRDGSLHRAARLASGLKAGSEALAPAR